jgi:hypothetical protein
LQKHDKAPNMTKINVPKSLDLLRRADHRRDLLTTRGRQILHLRRAQRLVILAIYVVVRIQLCSGPPQHDKSDTEKPQATTQTSDVETVWRTAPNPTLGPECGAAGPTNRHTNWEHDKQQCETF